MKKMSLKRFRELILGKVCVGKNDRWRHNLILTREWKKGLMLH
jgi:hypothetical protein